MRLKVGDTVTWTNTGVVIHSITADGVFDSGILTKDQQFAFTPDVEGTISYRCIVHPGQFGTLVVQPNGAQPVGG